VRLPATESALKATLLTSNMDVIPVLVAGAGPVGLIAAYTLAHHGVRCMLVERNDSTTRWPKMDITNVRSMEILRRLGLADDLREQGIPRRP
jgi:FAD-dependent monooxygenase